MVSNIVFIKAEKDKIDEVASKLHQDVGESLLVSKDNVTSLFGEGESALNRMRVIVPGYLVKAGVPTCNTEVAKLICYFLAGSRLRGIGVTFVAPTREYLDARIRRLLLLEVED